MKKRELGIISFFVVASVLLMVSGSASATKSKKIDGQIPLGSSMPVGNATSFSSTNKTSMIEAAKSNIDQARTALQNGNTTAVMNALDKADQKLSAAISSNVPLTDSSLAAKKKAMRPM